MTDPAHEKEYRTQDPIADAENTNHSEPEDFDGSEKEYIEIGAHAAHSSRSGSELGHDEKSARPGVDRLKSYATNTSAVTRTDSHVDTPPEKKSWFAKINPLRRGPIPPVPEVRTVSREYTASFLSLVYFQWMSPMMSASSPSMPPKDPETNALRLVTNDRSRRKISGRSIPRGRRKS